MAEFVVIELHHPLLGLSHSVFRKGEHGGKAICLCYSENEAALVAAALAAYTPVSLPEPARLSEPVKLPEVQAPEAKGKKPMARRQGRKKA